MSLEDIKKETLVTDKSTDDVDSKNCGNSSGSEEVDFGMSDLEDMEDGEEQDDNLVVASKSNSNTSDSLQSRVEEEKDTAAAVVATHTNSDDPPALLNKIREVTERDARTIYVSGVLRMMPEPLIKSEIERLGGERVESIKCLPSRADPDKQDLFVEYRDVQSFKRALAKLYNEHWILGSQCMCSAKRTYASTINQIRKKYYAQKRKRSQEEEEDADSSPPLPPASRLPVSPKPHRSLRDAQGRWNPPPAPKKTNKRLPHYPYPPPRFEATAGAAAAAVRRFDEEEEAEQQEDYAVRESRRNRMRMAGMFLRGDLDPYYDYWYGHDSSASGSVFPRQFHRAVPPPPPHEAEARALRMRQRSRRPYHHPSPSLYYM